MESNAVRIVMENKCNQVCWNLYVETSISESKAAEIVMKRSIYLVVCFEIIYNKKRVYR